MQDGVSANNVVREAAKASLFGGAVGFDFQYVPNVLVGSFKRTKPYRDAKEALAAPRVAGCDENLSYLE